MARCYILRAICNSVMEGQLSNKIQIRCGVRQGCLLLPLTFNIAIEPLAIAIQANWAIEGVPIKKVDAKIALYVDNMVCYLGNPLMSIIVLHNLIGEIGLVWGYKVN